MIVVVELILRKIIVLKYAIYDYIRLLNKLEVESIVLMSQLAYICVCLHIRVCERVLYS